MSAAGPSEPRELVGEIERRLEALEGLPDGQAREVATEAVQGLLELYGTGLERIVEVVAARDDDGQTARALADDELVSHLLLLHGLHPVALESRVREALQGVRPYLESHGGDVELLGIEGSAVRLRLRGSCSGCPSSAMTLKLAIEDAIHAAAPEIEEVIAAEEGAPPMGSPLLQIEDALPAALPLLAIEVTPAAAAPAQRNGSWSMAGTLAELSSAGSAVKTVGGQPILFLRLEGSFYGYRPFCPACQASLEQAVVRAAELTCPACGERFDVLRAGRGLDSPALHLQPVPLLVGDDGLVKVALPMGA